jgi:hypothetical protein
MPTLCVNDVIQYRPGQGIPRIVTVTSLGPDGFTGVITANKVDRVVGRYEQVLRVMKRADPTIDHRTKTTGKTETAVAWACTCGHTDVGKGRNQEAAMRNSRVQQEQHRRNVRNDDEVRDEVDED